MHVLIVEDDPIVADVFGLTLEEAGHFKTIVSTIEDALAELRHNRIDAILLDINLPDGNGTRLAQLVRKNHMLVPMLVISGNSGIYEKITALGAGADGYLTKPFDRYELMANLDAIMRRTHGHGAATISVGNLIVDLSRNYAKVNDVLFVLTA
ncbi:MAG: response regulator transcription factor [Candidatus Puniceispirillum sp.]